MHLLLLLAAPYFQFEATYLHTSLQLVICYSQHHIVHRGSGTGNKAAANSRIAAGNLVYEYHYLLLVRALCGPSVKKFVTKIFLYQCVVHGLNNHQKKFSFSK